MRTTTLHAGGAARRSSPDGATGLGSVSAGRPASPHVSELPLPAKAKPGTSNVTSQPLEPGAGSTRTSCSRLRSERRPLQGRRRDRPARRRRLKRLARRVDGGSRRPASGR